MNKIYTVEYAINDFDTWNIYAYCSTKEIAEEKKQELLDKIKFIKNKYWEDFNKDYDTDFSVYSNSDYLGDEWEEIADRIILYKSKYEELEFSDITVEEKELL